MSHYWTIVIPWVSQEFATRWHPTDRIFDPLTRGAFETAREAIQWAKGNLDGTPYTLRKMEGLFPGPSCQVLKDGLDA